MSPPPPPSLPSTNHILARDRDNAQPSSRSQIAALLTDSYKEIEALRHSLTEEKRRADHWKSLAEAFDAASSNGSSQDLHDKIRGLEQRAYSAECLRDEEMARRVAITDLWCQLRDYLSVLDAHSKDARLALDRSVDIVGKGVGAGALIRELPVIPVPSITDIAGGEDKVYSSQGMLPPVGTHLLRKGQQSSAGGRVRPRSDSMEMGGHAAKKSRHESRPHRSHSRSSSHSSIDEMILQAADRDEGAMYTHPPPRRNGAGTGKLVPDGVLPQQQYQTHVFAPVVTGAPTKKGKYNPGSQVLETQQPSLTHPPHLSSHPASLSAHPSINVGIEQKIYPPTNEQGQRICRSCGQPGRYKEDKCVEKWGPGPMGPGTVCDRYVFPTNCLSSFD
ncbi:uncharacterized protein BT62DRAFT_927197 [Guyanagaster necrorhizus]|uniref:Uncharacterized protein n=1 Tax=Guyanagaster necrorhizus TaxID=856835 RepID=A0A9P7W305_9AGAR|nr:uncharacterized protein BT62DRAFT_927197 [Guyanagaster necrorhizus MCA 3950]KAG7451480.1 hypothetical protein BT62DRAFT_927197 [Guyanagaster necrorhizus MCA 3950]